MQPVAIDHPVDWGHHYRLVFHYVPASRQLSGFILGPVGSFGNVEKNLAKLVSLQVAGLPYYFQDNLVEAPSFSITVPRKEARQFELTIRMGGSDAREGELFGRYRITPKGLDYSEVFHKLSVFETRMLSNEKLYRWLPYPRVAEQEVQLKTDLHTHSSGQISAEGMLEVASLHAIPYPTRLLDVLAIPYDAAQICRTPRFFFPPTDAADPAGTPKEEDAVPIPTLSAHSRARLTAALSIPPDRQMTFGELEITVYRYRTPLSKHPQMARDLLLKTAEEYAETGVVYAEITATSTSLLLPDYVNMLHASLPQIEAATGVALRFLVGLPRNLPGAMLWREVQKLKLMGASPYIVGVDFMGFEDNKIGELEPYMQEIAVWAQAHDPEFTLRIHAGENRKNLTNVKESLRLAQKYGMRVRIGHAAHGLDEEAMVIAEVLATEKLAMIEFNPDSNLALNNIDTAEELDMAKCINRDIPFVICSDGGGLFQTDVRQLELAASFAGVGQNRIASVVQHEADHLAREQKRFARKQAQLPEDFLTRIAEGFADIVGTPLPSLPPRTDHKGLFEAHLRERGIAFSAESIAEATAGKVPILLLGATGERYWHLITPPHRAQIAEVIAGMVAALDARKAYFLIGRPKHEGITTLLSQAVQAHNAEVQTPFALISATVQADQTTHSFTPGLTHVLPLSGSLFSVPNQLVSHVNAKNGVMLAIGGGTFVRDAILIARDTGVDFALMKGPEGAATDKAVMMKNERQFHDTESLRAFFRRVHPGLLL
ncbi:MAG: hypothetical protein K2Q01_02145 [Rickettsiales bacterium]|nr:hypothetical protein [Rickettsiales bacterium]